MAKYTKNDLKQLMREKLAQKCNRIDSPLAAYDASGKLTCKICLTTEKESSWSTHLLSKQHKEGIERLKKQKATKTEAPLDISKQSQKRPAASISTHQFDLKMKQTETKLVKQPETAPPEVKVAKLDTEASQLPAGFFDNPIQDAKVRNVVYKDPMEEEWSNFQKVVNVEVERSDFILEDELGETQKVRTIEEIDEQLTGWTKIDQLQKKMEKIRSVKKEKKTETSTKAPEDDDTETDANLDVLLDWRSRKNVKK